MAGFPGFPAGKAHLVPVPSAFFSQVLAEVDHLGELKICLYAFWLLDRQEGKTRYFRLSDCLEDEALLRAFGCEPAPARAALQDALQRAVRRGVLLQADLGGEEAEAQVFFLNSARGRAALKALAEGEWSVQGRTVLDRERPNIYQLYEQNIGPLTPLLVDALREAEQEYPPEWIEEAVRAAVENNVRRWRYIEAILVDRKKRGAHEQNRRNAEEDRRKYVEGEFSDFIEH